MSRVFIVGWDGATFDLIKPWIADGQLPHIAQILDDGVHGELRSTLPPMTFPAWTSFMTGKNPAKHGIFDFTRQRPGSYDLEFVNGGQRQAPSFWKLLSDAGRRVISISVPCTYPPEPVNGVMISGFDAPGLGGKSARADSRGMYPPELCDELNREIGGHPMGAFIINEVNRGTPEIGLERMIKVVERKAATAKYLMETRDWDCFMILFGESDGVAAGDADVHGAGGERDGGGESVSGLRVPGEVLAVTGRAGGAGCSRGVGERVLRGGRQRCGIRRDEREQVARPLSAGAGGDVVLRGAVLLREGHDDPRRPDAAV